MAATPANYLFEKILQTLSSIDSYLLPDPAPILLKPANDRGYLLFSTLILTPFFFAFCLSCAELGPTIYRRLIRRILPPNLAQRFQIQAIPNLNLNAPLQNGGAAPIPNNQPQIIAAIDLHLVNSDLRRLRLAQLRPTARLVASVAVVYLLVDTVVKTAHFLKEAWVHGEFGQPCSLNWRGVDCAFESVLKVAKWILIGPVEAKWDAKSRVTTEWMARAAADVWVATVKYGILLRTLRYITNRNPVPTITFATPSDTDLIWGLILHHHPAHTLLPFLLLKHLHLLLSHHYLLLTLLFPLNLRLTSIIHTARN
ncbi:hypothetical protein HK097_001198, partial [Rhizophlyctis rosea]